MTAQNLGSGEFARKVATHIEERFGADHPALKKRVQRHVYNAIVDGRLGAERVRGRWVLGEDMVPVAADLLLSTAA